LFRCSFDTKKEDYLIPGIPFRYCYVYATATYPSSAERNYYRILGVAEKASQDEIKKAFHSIMEVQRMVLCAEFLVVQFSVQVACFECFMENF
jgi:hypothetical protein